MASRVVALLKPTALAAYAVNSFAPPHSISTCVARKCPFETVAAQCGTPGLQSPQLCLGLQNQNCDADTVNRPMLLTVGALCGGAHVSITRRCKP